MRSLTHVRGAEATAAEVQDYLVRDSALVVGGVAGLELVAALNSDPEGFVEDLGVGLRNPGDDAFVDLIGSSTVRFEGRYLQPSPTVPRCEYARQVRIEKGHGCVKAESLSLVVPA